MVVEHALPGSTHTHLLTNGIKWMGGFEGRCLLGGFAKHVVDVIKVTNLSISLNIQCSAEFMLIR